MDPNAFIAIAAIGAIFLAAAIVDAAQRMWPVQMARIGSALYAVGVWTIASVGVLMVIAVIYLTSPAATTILIILLIVIIAMLAQLEQNRYSAVGKSMP